MIILDLLGVSHQPWVLFGLGLLALSVALGFLTPVLSILGCVVQGASIFGAGHTGLAVMQVLNFSALALLGPGAYSLDARFFGRRVIVFPAPKKPFYHL